MDLALQPGVEADMGPGDEWPALLEKITPADIVVLSTPTVALAAVVGNEDGAHKIAADLFQEVNDIGFSIPAQGCTYWNGEAMQGTNYNDLDDVPEAVAATTETAARNAVHLATLLRQREYPPYE